MSAQTERQRAFVGLLRTPVVDRQRHTELWSMIRRHRSLLADWFASRLGYRLLVTDTAARVFRLPLDDTVIAPTPLRPPSRRVIVLALLAAAAAEDAEDVTTTQDLSQRVQALTNHVDVDLEPYESTRFAHRLHFVKAIRLLRDTGALRPASLRGHDNGEGWAHGKDAIGDAYEVQREMLLRLADPRSVEAAVAPRPGEGDLPDSAPRFGLLRRLLELPVCLYADLTEQEQVYLRSQRQRVLAWCAEMTGWLPEQRAEGIALIAREEAETDLPFPQLRAVDFTTLMVLDELLRSHGVAAELDSEDIAHAAAEVRARYPTALTNELKVQGAIEGNAVELLAALDLIRAADGDTWRLTPVAGRFRDPEVTTLTARLSDVVPA